MRYGKLEVSSPTFKNGGFLHKAYTGYGRNISPDFNLPNLSKEAKSLVIILEDISHPFIKNYTHWVAWNIKPSASIRSDIRKNGNIVEGRAFLGHHKYKGPKPPLWFCHKYRFTILALDKVLDISPKTTKKKLLKIIKNDILQKGHIECKYKRGS